MNVNKILKKTCVSILTIMMLFTNVYVILAATESELRNQKNSIDEQIAQTNTEIAGTKKQMTQTLTQINNLTAEINSYKDDISELNSQLSMLDTQIAEREENIKIQQEKFDEQQKLLNKRLVALYESGTTSYLDMLLGSEGLADFISKYY